MMTIVTSTNEKTSTDPLQPVEWKTLLEHLNEPTKLDEWIQSIRRWEEVFQRVDDDPLVKHYLYISTYSILETYQRNSDYQQNDLIQCGKLTLKYLLENVLFRQEGDERMLTLKSMSSWCSGENQLQLIDLKDSIDLIKRSDLPRVEQRRCRSEMDLMEKLSLNPLKSQSLSDCLRNYFQEIHGDERLRKFIDDFPRKSSLKFDLDFIRHSFQLKIFDRMSLAMLKQSISFPFRCLDQLFDDDIDDLNLFEQCSRILIDFGEKLRQSTRLSNSRDIFLNYHLKISIILSEKLRSIAIGIVLERYSYFVALLFYSIYQILSDLSFNDEKLAIRNEKFDFINDFLQPAERYAYVYRSKVFQFFFHLLVEMSLKRNEFSSKIPDAPPLLIDLSPNNVVSSISSEETFDLDNLFNEKSSLTPKTTTTTTIPHHRSFSMSNERILFEVFFENNSTKNSNEFDQLEKIYFNENSPSMIVDDIREMFNENNEVKRLADLIENSFECRHFIDLILRKNLLSEENEMILLKYLGIDFDGIWSLTKLSSSSLIFLIKILLKRSNIDLIRKFSLKFLQSFQHEDEISDELMEMYLLVFYRLNLSERKRFLIDLIDFIDENDGNCRSIVLFDYLMLNFYEISRDFLDKISQRINEKHRKDQIETSLFSQANLIVKKSFDSMALKFIVSLKNYSKFYSTCISRLNFTRCQRSTKVYQDILWQILRYLPPTDEFFHRQNSSEEILHLFRFENEICQEKSLEEFLDEKYRKIETKRNYFQLFRQRDEQRWSLFDLIVFQLLLRTNSKDQCENEEFLRIFIHEYLQLFEMNSFEQSLALIPLKSSKDNVDKDNRVKFPTNFDELIRCQENFIFDEQMTESNLKKSILRDLIESLSENEQTKQINDKELCIQIELNRHLKFLSKEKHLTDEMFSSRIYYEIFQLIFNEEFTSSNSSILQELIEYFNEHFSLELFQRNFPSSKTFLDLFLLTIDDQHSIGVFTSIVSLFNRLFIHFDQFEKKIQLGKDFSRFDWIRWLKKSLQISTLNSTFDEIERFFQYFVQLNSDQEQIENLLQISIDLAEELFNDERFLAILRLCFIISFYDKKGYRRLIPNLIRWLKTSIENHQQIDSSLTILSYLNDFLLALKSIRIHSNEPIDSIDDNDNENDDEGEEGQERHDDDEKKDKEFDPNQLCTFTKTKKEYAHQHWYHCHTCQMIKSVGICQICANVCHRDHEISYAKYGSFFCDCGAKEDGSCQALIKRASTIVSQSKSENIVKKSHSTKTSSKTNRQKHFLKQIQTERNFDDDDFIRLIFDEYLPEISLKYLSFLQKSLENHYQIVFNAENSFDLTQLYSQYEQISIEYDDFISSISHSQENTIEYVKYSLNNEHGQQIKQLFSTNSIRRQALSLIPSKQHLIISQEKGKQSILSIYQFNSLIKQINGSNLTSTSNESINKKKFHLIKYNSLNIPFTILSIQPNQFNPDYLALTGLKDCHIINLDSQGRLKESTILLQPNLDSTTNYIIRSQWISNQNQTQLALITADFIKIYDLTIDSISPIYYFILPTGKIRDCTFYYSTTKSFILIMASNGYIYYEQLSSSSSARNGSFYVTNTLDIKHPSITETNQNGILLGGGVSVYYSTMLKLLFWSYVQGKNFFAFIDSENIEKLLQIRSIDIRMNPTTSSSSTPSKTTSTYHSLCAWTEIPSHPGLISTMTQMTNHPILLFITPEHVRINEMKLQLKTTKILDTLLFRTDQQRTISLILTDDGQLKFALIDSEKTNFWLKKSYQKKPFYPLIDLDWIDHHQSTKTPTLNLLDYHYPPSDNETDDQQEQQHPIKRRKTTLPTLPSSSSSTLQSGTTTTTTTTTQPSSSQEINTVQGQMKFPVDFFESCQILTDYEFGGRDLLDVYNVAQLKLRLSNPNMFVANVRQQGFTLEVINKDSDTMVMTGVRIHIGSYAMDKSPSHFEYFGRTIQINHQQGPRWYDLCLTRQESIQSEKKFHIFIGPSMDSNHITVIDDVQVYGKTKVDFQWPEDIDVALSSTASTQLPTATTSTTTTTTNNPTGIDGNYLQSFRQTNDDKDLVHLQFNDRLLAYTMQVLTNSLILIQSNDRRSNLIHEILPLASSMFQLSLPLPLQRYLRELFKSIFIPSSLSLGDPSIEYYEYLDQLQLSNLGECLSKDNYLEYFNDIQTYEYLLLSLLSITRHRPHHIQRYLTIKPSSSISISNDVISKSASMQIFIPSLINILFSLLNYRPVNRLLESIDHPLIDLKQIEKLLHILVDIYHSLAMNEPSLCQQLIIESYIRLLTYHDYQINFIIKNALSRCMQPKIQRLISKLSTASDLNQQEASSTSTSTTNNTLGTTDKTFQGIPLSAQIYPNEDQMRPRWTERTNLVPPPPPPPPSSAPSASATAAVPLEDESSTMINDDAAMLQYALALSMATTEDNGTTHESIEPTIEYVDVDDETTNIHLAPPSPSASPSSSQVSASATPNENENENETNRTDPTPSIMTGQDHSDNNSLDEGDDGHVSESSSTTNETNTNVRTNNETTSTPLVPLVSISSVITRSSSSNDSTRTLKCNLNDSIIDSSSMYEQRLNEFKQLFIENLLENLDEKLIHNTSLNGLNSIAYLQFLLTLTIEFASKTDEINRTLVRSILQRLIDQMTFIHQYDDSTKKCSDELIHRTAEHEIQLMFLRLLTVFVSFMLKVRPHERDQYFHLSYSTAQLLEKSRIIDYCLYALQIVYQYLSKQPIDENLLNDSNTYSSPTVPSSAGTGTGTGTGTTTSLMILMKITGDTNLPDLSPFFYKQYTKHHHRDVFESYPELLAEICTRLPYQMKKIFDCTSDCRSFLFSTQWQQCLCEYYLLAQGNFLKRQIRKLLMYISGSREKYRKLRDLHVLESNMKEIQRIYHEHISMNDQRKYLSKQIPYSILMKLVDHLKSSQDISVQRSSNWQKFCKNHPSILPFLMELMMIIDDSLVPFILNLLINAISIPNASSSSSNTTGGSNRSLKPSKSVRTTDIERNDDLTIYSIVVQLSKMITNECLEDFIRHFLFEHSQQSIRWLTHQFLLNLYLNSAQQFQEHFFEIYRRFWSSMRFYGLKSFQYIDLLGYMILKCKDDQRILTRFLQDIELMLKEENQRLISHPNASIYRRLATIIDIEQTNGYFFESQPCLICNHLDIPYQQMKLQSIKSDQRYTTQSHIIKLIQAYSIQKLQIKMSDMKRSKTVRTIRLFYNNRQVQSIVDLRTSIHCKWLLAKTIRLANIQQNEVKIDFVIPIIACNLMIEYVDFFETSTSSSSSSSTSTSTSTNTEQTLQCPRCNSAVAATPGICPNCGENVFQCHKCRSINYDERDPFLCNSCGYCKYCKFDFIFTCKQMNYVEPIESDEDRTKTMSNISQLLEKTDKIYRQLFNQKPLIEYLLTILSSDEQISSSSSSISFSSSTIAPSSSSTSNNTGETSDPTQVPPPANIPIPTTTTSNTNGNGINRIVQQIAPKYHIECRQTYDELGKLIQKIIAARKELYQYDQRHTLVSSSSSSSSSLSTSSNEQCYGCILSTISHCILLLRALSSSSHRFKQMICQNTTLIDQLFLYNIRLTNQQIRHDVRLFFSSLTRDHAQLTDYLTKKIFENLQFYFHQQSLTSSSSSSISPSSINADLLLLHSLIKRSNQEDQDVCWQMKLRLILQVFLQSLQQSMNPQILEMITLPCLRMLLHLSQPHSRSSSSSSSSSTGTSMSIEEFLSNDSLIIKRDPSWLKILIFSSQSTTIRYLTCKFLQTLATDEDEKSMILKTLVQYLNGICQIETTRYSSEYVQLIKDFLSNDQTLKFLLNHDEEFHLIEHLAELISKEIERIHDENDENYSNSNLTFGYSIKCLTELLTLSLQQDQFKQKYKSILIGIVLNGYLSLKKLFIQRTKLIDEAQMKMLELLEQMTRGNEEETRQFMLICLNTIDKFPLEDMQTPLFIFERLTNLIYPEESKEGNKEFYIVVEKDPNQEDFLQGRMMGNPYSSNDSSMGPLMRDIKNKICTDCELIALLEDDNGMELLVANKIINLGLQVRDVYKKVWLPYLNCHSSSSTQQDGTTSEHEPMHIVYRMRGLLGDATEDIIETFETKKTNNGIQGEDDPEDIYRLAQVLTEHHGLETMLKRFDAIQQMSSGKALFEILLKLFEYAMKLKVNRQRLIDPRLSSIGSMLNKLNLLLKTDIEEQGRDQILLPLTERLLSLMDCLFHEASTTLSQDKYNEFSISCQGDIEQLRSLLNYIKLPFVKTHPTLMQALIHLLPYLSFGNKEKMQTLLDYFKSYLEFDRFDIEQTSSNSQENDNQLHLDCFCEICKHLDKKSIYGKEFRDLLNQTDGIIDQSIVYIEKNAPPVKTYLGMQDQESWKEFLNKPSLSYVLRLLTGLSSGHEAIQIKVGLSLISVLHKIEQLTTAGKVGVLAEDLLHSLTENEQVAKKIDELRNQTKTEKKRLAQEARDRKMKELNLKKSTRSTSSSETQSESTALPSLPTNDLIDEIGHVCCICREGYKYFPNKVLAIYTFTKKVDIEPMENKTRKTPGYTTVTHFNIIHIDCHTSAIKQARSRDEWESALLQNANTRCNGLLPLWGPDVPEAQFTTALARYDTNIVEGTGIRETSATLSIHDMKLLLLRFAELQSFSEDTGGGGRESNIRLIPYQIHAILYVLTTSRQIEREDKLLQNFLIRPFESSIILSEAFEVDGPYFMTTLALIMMKPNDWDKHRRFFLQRLLLMAHVRSTNTPSDRTRLTSKTLKSFSIYRTSFIFFGLIDAFFNHLFKPHFESISSTTPYHQQLAQFLRSNDALLMDTCTRILKYFEQDLLSQQTFDSFFNRLDLSSSLSEQVIQDMINAL